MFVSHNINSKEVKRQTKDNPGFLLTNGRGGYFSLGAKGNFTKYNGAYFSLDGFELFKTIESIHPVNMNVLEVKNHLYYVERINKECIEKFYMFSSNGIFYEIDDYSGEISIWLDCRKMYELNGMGRVYNVYDEGDTLIIEYTKFTDESLSKTDYKVFIAIEGAKEYKHIQNWFPFKYSYDLKRENKDCQAFLYEGLKLKVKNYLRLSFGFSQDKSEAVSIAKDSMEKYGDYLNYYKKQQKDLLAGKNFIEERINFAYACAKNSLSMLVVDALDFEGVFAGLPWFHQFWTRDEAVSVGALIQQGDFDLAKNILFRHLSSMEDNGRINNRYPSSKLASADGVGWTFKRLFDFLLELEEKNLLHKKIEEHEFMYIKKKLRFSIMQLLENYTKDGLVFNKDKETWMDTEFGGDTRSGFRIEIQALRLLMYDMMRYLCIINKKEDKAQLYKDLEEMTRQKVRENFFREYLYDGANEPTIRPNVFLAYYIYPQLLTKKEWRKTFDKAIECLWLDWGGFSSIDKNSPIFFPDYTGEDNKSYHRGDSWYFVNNIGAICLNRVDNKRYNYYIQKIVNASARDILYKGFIGHASEISSASFQRGEGCLAQAWSSATFIELHNEFCE
ncbi:MAG: amylo-alpha-1,6-glucosidase [Nanoarchaeota archaeon]